MGTASQLAQAVRDTVIPVVSHLRTFQKRFVQNLSELGIAYAGSPIVEGPGKRYWDESLRGGGGIQNRFLLLFGTDIDEAVRGAARQFCESSGGLVELRYVQTSGMTLVRPDGYIAYAVGVGNAGAALKSIRSLLERQTK
jgi:hypothetical protein